MKCKSRHHNQRQVRFNLPVGRIEGQGPGLVQIHLDNGRAHAQSAVANEYHLLAVIEEVPIIRRPIERNLTDSFTVVPFGNSKTQVAS